MHLETELIPFLSDELTPAERARVAAHVAACEPCRRAVEDSRLVLDALAASRLEPPALDWARYQMELRARVAARPRQGWWAWPVPALAAAAMLIVGVLVGGGGLPRVAEERRPTTDVVALDETALGTQLPMLREYRVVERLDMLEDLDVIHQLDRLDGTR